MVNISLGTAIALGLKLGKVAHPPTTAYLMLGGKCLRDCAFCSQARSSNAKPYSLSRISWPPFPEETVISRLEALGSLGPFKRICLQVTHSPGAFQKTVRLVRKLRERTPLPVDAAFLPQNFREVQILFEAGLDHLGFGLDAASERVFARVKGPGWGKALSLIEETAYKYPGRAAVHLIVGLGETEEEMIRMIQKMHDLGVITGLFAFTPLAGTRMENSPPPPLASYRRIQIARYLIVQNLVRAEELSFSRDGKLMAFPPFDLEVLSSGEAFRTSGCPDCNRPYYNERPSGPLYNFPYPPSPAETRRAIMEAGIWPKAGGL
ncbi:MAG: radical SAM protein [Anaerolineae bacterium]|nr:radical SAM protein [Anaerolineae bacterium]